MIMKISYSYVTPVLLLLSVLLLAAPTTVSAAFLDDMSLINPCLKQRNDWLPAHSGQLAATGICYFRLGADPT